MNQNSPEIKPVFKQCTNCGAQWETRDQFLSDPDIRIIGYQVNFIRLTSGFFMFNHSCHDTLSIQAKHFADLYTGPIFLEKMAGTDKCPEYCQRKDELKPCPIQCECAFVRDILNIIKNWTKRQ